MKYKPLFFWLFAALVVVPYWLDARPVSGMPTRRYGVMRQRYIESKELLMHEKQTEVVEELQTQLDELYAWLLQNKSMPREYRLSRNVFEKNVQCAQHDLSKDTYAALTALNAMGKKAQGMSVGAKVGIGIVAGVAACIALGAVGYRKRVKHRDATQSLLRRNGFEVDLTSAESRRTAFFNCPADAIVYLHHAGCDVNSTNELGVTPLVYYLRSRNYEHVRFLLACGAHVFAPWESALFMTKWEQDPRILHMAMDVRVPDDLFRSLVKSVPPKQISQAVALLHNAISSGRTDYCDILITAGASVNNCMVYGNNSISPLHDVVLVDARGCGIAFFKDEGERYEKVRHLIKSLVAAGADINIIGFDVQLNMDMDVSPLHLTSFLGCIYSAKFLLDHGADINLLNNHKKSPLHITASKYPRPYCTGTLQLLLEHGARLDLRDNTDRTAEELARARGRHDIADMIAAESLARTKWSEPRNAWIGVVVRATHRRHGSR